MKRYIPGRIIAEAQSNLKFRIAIFGSHFSKVEKSRSRHVAPSKFFAGNGIGEERRESRRKESRKTDRGKGIYKERRRKEKEGRGEREGERKTKKGKTMKKELGRESYRSGRWKGDTKEKAETYST